MTLRFDDIAAGWEQWILLMSDNHHDSKYCNRKLERKHLQMAKDRGAFICMFGDVFDAMQGKFDPRRSLGDVRPEDMREDYYDSIVEHAVEDYGEFADNIILLTKGNHEAAVLNKTNTDLISNLVYRLNAEHTSKEHRIYPGCYGGWVRFMFTINKTKRSSLNLKYHHGFGGSAPVTKGMIHTNRQQVYEPDADVVVNGHNHQNYITAIPRERLYRSGKVGKDRCWHIRIPGYKDEYGDGGDGFIVERGVGPSTNGGMWLRLYADGHSVDVQPIPEIE